MEKAYNVLADYFEYLNENCGYENWSQYLVNKLSSFENLHTGIDIGCGSGYFTRKLEQSGYKMIGIDCSEPMLSKAVQLSKKAGLKSQYILQKVQTLKLNDRVDFGVSINDCFNYIDDNHLTTSFKKVHNALNKNGIFLFDISSKFKLQNIIGNNMFGEDAGEVAYLWFNTLHNDSVDMEITMFTQDVDGKYIKKEESHKQYIHEESVIINSLEEAGFSILSIEGHLGQEKTDTSERLNFICKRT